MSVSRIARRVLLTCASSAVLLAIPSVAGAATYCVGAGACAVGEGTTQADLEAAFTAADNATPDTIKIGPGTFEIASYLISGDNDPLTVVGAGRGVTILHISDGGGSKGISLADDASSISNLDVDTDYVTNHTSNTPISIFSNVAGTGPHIHDVNVYGDGYRGISLRGYAFVQRVDVRLRRDLVSGKSSTALSRQSHASVPTALTRVYDSHLEGAIAVSTQEAGTFEMQRSSVVFSWKGVAASATGYLTAVEHDVRLANDVIRYVADPDHTVSVNAIDAQAGSGDPQPSDLDVFVWDSTIVAESPLNVGIRTYAGSTAPDRPADVYVNASGLALVGPINYHGTATQSASGGGTAGANSSFTFSRSTTAPNRSQSGGGFVDLGGLSQLADMRFVDQAGGDYRLQWNSPLVDAGQGDPGQVPAWLSATDIAGAARPVWSTGSSAPMPKADIGAHEYNRALPVASALISAASVAPGASLSLTGSATDANPGEGAALTYAWTLPGGATATTANATFTAPTLPGSYQASLVVTDPSGAASLPAAVSFTVVASAVPPTGGTPTDTTAPKVRFGKLTASLRKLLKRAPITAKYTIDERASVAAQLTATMTLPPLKKGKPVRKLVVVLAANKAVNVGAGTRSVKLTPTVAGLKRFAALRKIKGAKVTGYSVVLVATDAATNAAKPVLKLKMTR